MKALGWESITMTNEEGRAAVPHPPGMDRPSEFAIGVFVPVSARAAPLATGSLPVVFEPVLLATLAAVAVGWLGSAPKVTRQQRMSS